MLTSQLLQDVALQVLPHRKTRFMLEQLRDPLQAVLENDGIDRTSALNGSRLTPLGAHAMTGYLIRNAWTPEMQVCLELHLHKSGVDLRLAAYEQGKHVVHPDRFLDMGCQPTILPLAEKAIYQMQVSWTMTADGQASEILKTLPLMLDAAQRRLADRGATFMEQLYEWALP